MRKLLGFKNGDFTSKDGKQIEGFNLFVAVEIKNTLGMGCEVERIYLSKVKIEKFDIDLEDLLGKEIIVVYNKYGKIDEIRSAE